METLEKRLNILELLSQIREMDLDGGWVEHSQLTETFGESKFILEILEEVGQITKQDSKYKITGHGVLQAEIMHKELLNQMAENDLLNYENEL